MKCKQWEIWDADVKYEDAELYKKRPVLIIDAKQEIAVALKMTGQAPRTADEYIIKEWQKSSLDKPTTIRTSKVLKIKDNVLVKKRGSILSKERVPLTALLKKMKLI